MLPAFLPHPAHLLARSVNALLEREPWARERLARHAGKTVRLRAGGFELAASVTDRGTFMQAAQASEPDVTLSLVPERLEPARLLRAARENDPDAFTDVTRIEGDASLAQVVAELARHLRPDPEDELARLVGDIPAARLAAGLRFLGTGVRTAAERLSANVAEYLAEESGLLAGRPRLHGWRQDMVDTSARLDAAAARLAAAEARVRRLAAARGQVS